MQKVKSYSESFYHASFILLFLYTLVAIGCLFIYYFILELQNYKKRFNLYQVKKKKKATVIFQAFRMHGCIHNTSADIIRDLTQDLNSIAALQNTIGCQ